MKAQGDERTSRSIENVSRRQFLGGVFSAGAFVLAARVVPDELFAQARRRRSARAPKRRRLHPSVYLGIEPDGTVFIVTHRSEMGTGIRTTLPVVAADELDADWSACQDRAGHRRCASTATRTPTARIDPRFLRRVPAGGRLGADDAREAAAAQWSVPASECAAREPRGRSSAERTGALGYGALARRPRKLPVPQADRAAVQAEERAGATSARTSPTYDLQRHRHRQGAVRHGRRSATAWCTPRSSIRRCSAARCDRRRHGGAER